ncbi:hypothetical protein QTP88_009615 [Uroleucon formosanum]
MSRKSGNICAYYRCGKGPRNYDGLRLFRFPKDQVLCKKWIENSGNIKLIDFNLEELNKKHLCMLHFSDSDYTFNKRNLIKSAVPKMFETDDITLKVLTPKKTYIQKYFPKSPEQSSTSFQTQRPRINSLETTPTSSKIYNSKNADILYLSTPTKSVKNLSSKSYLLSSSPETPNTKSIIQTTMHFPSPSISSKVLFSNLNSQYHKMNKELQQLKQVVKNQSKLLNYKCASISKLRKNLLISNVQCKKHKSF